MSSASPVAAQSSLFGRHGRALHIDATSGGGSYAPISADVSRRFVGGSGLGVYLLLKADAPRHDPFAAEAPLVFVFSPLVGSPLTTSAKFAVCCKSPLTQRINDSLASSRFAINGKRTGADAVVITGRAPELSILVIDDGAVRRESAAELTGLSIPETERRLHARFGGDYSFAVIGPAGENLVRYATISHDGRHAGRGGSGAVLGAKNIKALAVRGTQRTPWAYPEELTDLAKKLSERSFGPATAKYRELGTAANLLVFNRLGALPTRNFQSGTFESAAELAPETLSAAREKTRAYCAACTIGCEHIYSLRTKGDATDGEGQTAGVRLEYENLFALGPLCGISDSQIVLTASQRCDQLGIDTISVGGSIAFAMECVERGLLDAPWLRFGDGAALLRAIDEIACRSSGLGNMLAEGSRRAAAAIGQDSLDFAPQVKGLEIPGYEPRALQTMALGFAVGTRGADHNRSGAYEVDFRPGVDRRNLSAARALDAVETEDRAAIMDSLIVCKFLRGVFEDFYAEGAEMLRLITGEDVTADELRQTARRITTAKKLFNIRAGWTPCEDTLPARFLHTSPADEAATRLTPESLAAAVSAYNLGRGWLPDGRLTPQMIAEHALADV